MFDPDDGRADAVDVLQVSVQLAKYRTVQYSTVQSVQFRRYLYSTE